METIKINNEKLLFDSGLSFDSVLDLYFYVLNHIEYLSSHNKNYTKQQEHRINDLLDIFNNIEVEEI